MTDESEDKMKLAGKVVGGFLVTLLWMLALNQCLAWIGEPSTARVIIGVVGAAILCGLALGAGAALIQRRIFARNQVEQMARDFQKWAKFSVVLLVAFGLGACTRVDPGHVGIQVNYYGTDRGVDSYPRVTGMVFFNPISTTVFQYPTFVQTAVWTQNTAEGKPINEEITFTTGDQMQVAADISIAYHLEADRVPAFYVKFRSDDLDHFTHGFLRNLAREKFDNLAGKYKIEAIMGDNAQFLREVRESLQSELAPIGVDLDQFGFIGAPRPPAAVIASINAKVQATQLAQQKQNELMQAQADAAKEVAKTEGYAKSLLIRAEAEARGNHIVAQSLTRELIELRALEKWNGALPTMTGGAIPFINVTR